MPSKVLNDRLALLLGIIIFTTPILRFSWDLPTQTILHILIIPSLLLLINNYKSSFKLFPEGVFLALFAGISLSIIGAQEKATVRNELFILFDCLTIGYFFTIVDKKSREKLMLLPIMAGMYFTVIMLFQFVKNPIAYIFYDAVNLDFIVNYNVLAGYLSLAFPISLSKLDEGSLAHKILSGIVFIGIILTKSRIVLLVAVISFAVFVLVKHKKYLPILKALLILMLALLTALTFLKISQQKVFQGSGLMTTRLLWWQTALNMITANPILGIGWGNFSNLYQVYRNYIGLNTVYCHNIVLQVAAEAGLIGISLFLFTIASFYRSILKKLNEKFSLFALLSASSFLLANFFDFSFFITAPMILFFIVISSGSETILEKREKPLFNLPIITTVCLISVFMLSKPLIGAVFYQRAILQLKNNSYDLALSSLNRSLKFDPLPSHLYTGFAQAYFSKYNAAKNETAINNAIKYQLLAIAHFKESALNWSDLAWLYRIAGEKERSIQSIQLAVKYDRSNPKYKQLLNDFKE